RDVEPRPERRLAALIARASQTTCRRLLAHAARKRPFEQERENSEQLDELPRRVAEADPAVRLDMTVAVDEALQNAAEVERVATEILRRQVLAVALSALAQETRPLEGEEGDGDCSALSNHRADPRH